MRLITERGSSSDIYIVIIWCNFKLCGFSRMAPTRTFLGGGYSGPKGNNVCQSAAAHQRSARGLGLFTSGFPDPAAYQLEIRVFILYGQIIHLYHLSHLQVLWFEFYSASEEFLLLSSIPLAWPLHILSSRYISVTWRTLRRRRGSKPRR